MSMRLTKFVNRPKLELKAQVGEPFCGVSCDFTSCKKNRALGFSCDQPLKVHTGHAHKFETWFDTTTGLRTTTPSQSSLPRKYSEQEPWEPTSNQSCSVPPLLYFEKPKVSQGHQTSLQLKMLLHDTNHTVFLAQHFRLQVSADDVLIELPRKTSLYLQKVQGVQLKSAHLHRRKSLL